jgi:hypothetical protein
MNSSCPSCGRGGYVGPPVVYPFPYYPTYPWTSYITATSPPASYPNSIVTFGIDTSVKNG